MSEIASEIPPAMAADSMLGKLARLLRMLGFDVTYLPDAKARKAALAEGRLLLTRDRGVYKTCERALYIETAYPFHQARQVMRSLKLHPDRPFSRCIQDNFELVEASTEQVEAKVPERIQNTSKRFLACPHCGRVFWEGSHVGAMRRLMEALQEEPVLPDADEDENEHPSSQMLEPLLDLHQALDVLMQQHRLALMDCDIRGALTAWRRFSMNMARHLDLENQLVLPFYGQSPPIDGYERGGAPVIFEKEHEKILSFLMRFEEQTEALKKLPEEQQKLGCLALLDREKVFVDLLEHHDQRERAYLYPRLAELLTSNEQADLLERMMAGLPLKETS